MNSVREAQKVLCEPQLACIQAFGYVKPCKQDPAHALRDSVAQTTPFLLDEMLPSSARTCLLRLCNHKSNTCHQRFATHFAGHNVLISCGWRIPTYSALAEKAHEKMHAQGLQGCAMAATDSASNQPRLQNFQALQTCLEEEMRGRVPAPRWTW
jgi:hypothetical protein